MMAIISHDAGGAELLSSYVKTKESDFVFALDGPAVSIFQRKLGNLPCMSVEDAIYKADTVLCGTSWPASLEWRAIKIAREQGKRSIAFLEHWVNYEQRFVRNEEKVLPDKIWVGDVYAREIAKKTFPNVPIVLFENPYLKEIEEELEKLDATDSASNILYVCEPIQEHTALMYGDKLYHGYTEYDALRYFLDNIDVYGQEVDEIVIRLHPSELAGKYDALIAEYDLPIKCSQDRALLQDIHRARVVVGCNTMAMVVGLLAKTRVVSAIPFGGKPCLLPHQEIESLQDLVLCQSE